MRKLSSWGKAHLHLARTIIVSSRLLLVWLSWFLGQQIVYAGGQLSPLWLYPLCLVFFTACALYPEKRSAATYVQRKTCDAAVAVSGFLLMLCLTAQLGRTASFYQRLQAAVPVETPVYKYPEAQTLIAAFQHDGKTRFTRKEKRIIRKEFTYQLLQYATATVSQNKEQKSNAGAIIVACIAAVGLLFLVASLACSLSCNGHDAAAAVVGIGGTAAIALGLYFLIRSLKRKKQASINQQPDNS